MAPRAIWTGNISFGLVNIPVRLVTAVREHEIRFHQLHEKDGVRLRQRLICPAEDVEVDRKDIVKGYEIAPDQYIVMEDKELDKLVPESTRAIEISDFVDLAEIDPIYYDRPYYLLPDEGASRPYRLLVEAMKKANKVGIARFVMRQKGYLAALRPLGHALCMEIMHFADEVLDVDELEGLPETGKVDEKQLKMADQLIDSLSTEFDPEKYKDEYHDQVEELLKKKAKGQEIVVPEAVEVTPTKAADLLAALEESLKAAKEREKAPA
jgi:DNA end-binding protein Ku